LGVRAKSLNVLQRTLRLAGESLDLEKSWISWAVQWTGKTTDVGGSAVLRGTVKRLAKNPIEKWKPR
jgi:hypothetical protein